MKSKDPPDDDLSLALIAEARSLRAQMEMTEAGTNYEIRGRKREDIGPTVDFSKVLDRYVRLMADMVEEWPALIAGQIAYLSLALDLMASTVTGNRSVSLDDRYHAIMLVRLVKLSLEDADKRATWLETWS